MIDRECPDEETRALFELTTMSSILAPLRPG